MRTYVIRIHTPGPAGSGPETLRGVADEIVTGRRTTFTSGADLLRLLSASDATDHDTAHQREE